MLFELPTTFSIGTSPTSVTPLRIAKTLILLSLLFALGVACTHAEAQAYSFPGQTPVGSSSAAIAVKVPIKRAGNVSAIRVLGQGNAAVDFTGNGSGSCTVGISYPLGQTCTVGVLFTPLYPGFRSGAVQLLAQDGSVMGTQFVSGVGTGAIGRFVPGEISTVAGHAAWLYNSDGILAINASIFLPYGIAVDSVGNMYIADSGNNRVRKVTAATGVISTIAGTGALGGTGDGGPAVQATLNAPTSVALDGAGNIYICDSANEAVRRIDPNTGLIATVAGVIGKLGYSGDGAPASAATLNSPNGISVDSAGNLFIADTANNAIRRVDAVTGLMTTVAGTGVMGYSGDDGMAVVARLNAPWSVTPSSSGGLYIADQGNNRIRKIDATGVMSTVVGTGASSYGGDGGLATQAALNAPASVAIDVAGNLYVADSGNNLVREVNVSTGIISTMAGASSQSFAGDGGPATSAGLYGPYTLTFDGLGNLYIADVFHMRIREVAANGAVLDFDPMRIGRVATAQQVTLENDGNAPLTVSAVLPVSQSQIDGPTTTCLSALTLAPLSTCVVGAAFAPTSLGTPDTGKISVTSNAANSPGVLVLSGNVLSEDPSTVSLSASSSAVNLGDTIYFTVSVSSVGVVPTGQITLLDGVNTIGTQTLQAGGVAMFNIATLTGGTHTITASYVGDTNNTSGVSSPLTVTVKEPTAATQTKLATSASSALAGVPVVLTATVVLVNSGSGTGTLGGSVTFTDGPTIIGVASVSGGTASISVSTLAVGQHTVTAAYGGTATYASSSSAPLTLAVEAGTTGVKVSSSSNPSLGGVPVVLTAAAASNGATPTGTVTFVDGSTTLGVSVVNSTAVATLKIPALSVGAHSIVAMYGGDVSNSSSSSSPLLQTVNIATTSSVVTSSLNPAPQSGPVTLTATVTSNGGIPGGSVEFFDGSASLGMGKLNAAGVATLTSATLGLGPHSITAVYSGDALDSASTSAALVQTVQPATSTVAFSSGANPSPFGSSLVLSVLVHGTGARPVGTITLQDGSSTLGVQSLDPNGLATFSMSNLPIGIHNLVALYSGDTVHAANSATLTQTVQQVTTTALVSSAPKAIAGAAVTWTAAVAGLSGQPATGTVQFKDGSTVVASIAVGASGTAAFSSSTLAVGTHPMSAAYSGDPLDQASTSTPLVETVQIATTSTVLTPSANPAFTGATLVLTATVTGNGGAPGGSITFLDGTTVLGTVPLSASGVASLSTSTLTPGIHALTASYSGDANDSTSSSAAVSEEIVQQTMLTLTSSANPSMFQDNVTLTVSVSGGLSAYPATGAVTLTDGGATVATANLNALGAVSFTLTAPSLGNHTLQATYAGDTRNSPAASTALTQSVILRPTTTGLRISAAALSAGQQVTFASIVQGVGPHIPTGTITFVSGTNVLGTAKLDATGLAVMTFTPPQATDNVIAQYPGDTLFAASNSGATIVTVGPPVEFTMSVTPASVSMQSGAHATLTLTIASATTFTDTLALGCAGLPASATCTFSQDQVKIAAGGMPQTLSVVIDTGNPLGSGASASLSPAHTGTTLACILPGGLLLSLLLPVRRFRRQFVALAMLLLLGVCGALSGCANSLNVNNTPAGSYSFQIVGTGTTTGATQSGAVSLTVTN